MDKYGKYIREVREKNGDTREETAKKLDISESALGKYERGERKIKPDLLEKLADLYDVPLSSLFGEEGELPQALKDKGVKWISFIDEMEEKKLTPEQIKAAVDFIEKWKLGNK